MKTISEQLDEMMTWAITEWDDAIDAVLADFGPGAKPTRGERMMHSREVYAVLRDVAEGLRRSEGRATPGGD